MKDRNNKKESKKTKITKSINKSKKETRINKTLIENFIALQRVMINLSSKFDSLSKQIERLLELFEISAKTLAKKDIETITLEAAETKKILEKLDTISQQAGLIGKGLALIHEANTKAFSTPQSSGISDQNTLHKEIGITQKEQPRKINQKINN
ncbi:MAG: hypothetical protein QXX55_01645 [Candidatus Pacearchaeota archaeon]